MGGDAEGLTPVEYERLSRDLTDKIAQRAPVTTLKLEHNVKMVGKATTHQIDLVWEFTTSFGIPHRIIFECRRYGSPLKQSAVFAFSGVIDDLADAAMPTTGVMVTTTGYQPGARNVASAHGIMILELRDPREQDVQGRLMSVYTSFSGKVAHISDLRVQATEMLTADSQILALNYGLQIETPDGQRTGVMELLQRGELTSSIAELTPAHQVTREFSQPVVLLAEGEPVAKVQSVSAIVQEVPIDPFDLTVGGRERLSWMVKDTLSGQRIWFAVDGKIHVTES